MYKNLIEHIIEAKSLAILNNIRPDTLLLNKDLAISRGFVLKFSFGGDIVVPNLVLGMRAVYAQEKEMPSNVDFIIGHSPIGENSTEHIILDNFSNRLGINLITLSLLEQNREIYFVNKDGEVKNAVIDSIDIINHTIIAHEPSVNRFRVKKYECRKFTFNKYGKEFSLTKEELEC